MVTIKFSLKTQFSRVEFSKALSARQNIVAVRSVRIDLPAGATEVYYRDDIGNVSTSNLRQEKKRTVLELRPRFPLFGGWNYNWYHGYNLNLWDFVKYSTSLDKYVMDVDLVQGISDVPVDLLRVKVVLPEGATEIKVLPAMDTPVNIVKTFTYIDTIGRPTVLFEKRNLVDENFRRFQVHIAINHGSQHTILINRWNTNILLLRVSESLWYWLWLIWEYSLSLWFIGV